jgi:hypothetical protein
MTDSVTLVVVMWCKGVSFRRLYRHSAGRHKETGNVAEKPIRRQDFDYKRLVCRIQTPRVDLAGIRGPGVGIRPETTDS